MALEAGVRRSAPEAFIFPNRRQRNGATRNGFIRTDNYRGRTQEPGRVFEILYRRYVSRLGHNQTVGIIAHKLCRLVWKILHQGIRYEERGPEVKKGL